MHTHLILLKWLGRIVFLSVTILVTVVTVRAFDARKLPDLKVWHRVILDAEFTAGQADETTTLEDYLNIERRLFAQLRERVYARVGPVTGGRLNRYAGGSRSDPSAYDQNWNRTYEMRPASPIGGALLIHGLSDSPYSLRHIAELLFAQGYYVLGLRMPGHGTVPTGLIEADWEDWAAVVELGARHVAGRIPDGGGFVLAGYSNGGALALNYLADALDREDLPTPGQVILFSPMLGISPFAIFAESHKLLSWIPYFEKSKWVDIYPEYDPFKYNSFPMEAGHQSYELIRTLSRKLKSLADAGRMGELPPILAFQSLVDATVSTSAIVHRLFDRLDGNDDELVLFDVNHMSVLKDFIEPRYDRTALLASLEKRDALPYGLTVITNEEDDSPRVAARIRPAGEAGGALQRLDLDWPPQVYSLAHVAIPFPSTDPVYGIVADARDAVHIAIGMLHPRGERGVLNVPPSLMLRLRYNPFFSYIEKRVLEKLTDGGQ